MSKLKLVAETHECDKANGVMMWADAIKKEMPKIITAINEHQGEINDLVSYKQITGHMVFDMKLGENFR